MSETLPELTKEDLQDEILSILFNYLLKENKEQEKIIKNILKLEVIKDDNSNTTYYDINNRYTYDPGSNRKSSRR